MCVLVRVDNSCTSLVYIVVMALHLLQIPPAENNWGGTLLFNTIVNKAVLLIIINI